MAGFFGKMMWAGAALALLLMLFLVIYLTTGRAAAAGAISQSYTTKSSQFSKGALLSLVSNGSTEVEVTNSGKNLSRLVGVAADESLLEFSDGGAGKVKVVTDGLTDALVSDMNGPVRSGDKITASPVSGIGMKAVGSGEVVGTAQTDLAAVTTVSQSVEGTDGKQRTIKVGLLPVAVSVTYYSPPNLGQDTLSALVPAGIQSLANNIAGRQVSALRVLLSGVVLLVAFVIVTMMLYTSIRNGMISIGRNPMAQQVVRSGVKDVMFAAIAVMVLSVGIVYGTLKF